VVAAPAAAGAAAVEWQSGITGVNILRPPRFITPVPAGSVSQYPVELRRKTFVSFEVHRGKDASRRRNRQPSCKYDENEFGQSFGAEFVVMSSLSS